MKNTLLALLILSGFVIPWACTNKVPTGPLATFNLTATFTNTVTLTPTNWAGFTSTNTPTGPTNTPTMTATVTNTHTVTVTSTPTATVSIPTPVPTGTNWTTSQAPNGLAWDGGTNIYAAEGVVGQTGGQIQVFNTSGSAVSVITTTNGTNPFGQPNGVACQGGNIYVVDSLTNSVYVINPGTNALVHTITTWASSSGPTSFISPEGIAVDGSGNIYVADTGNGYVEVFDSSYTSQAEINTGTVALNDPSSLAVDGSGNIYVADQGNQLVQKFVNAGSYSYGSPSSFSTGSSSGIYAIALDTAHSNNIYLADADQGIVTAYSSAILTFGAYLTSGLGISASNISPDGLVFIGTNLLVADYSNNALYLVTP